MSDESQLAPHLYKMLSGESLDNTTTSEGSTHCENWI